LLGFVLGRVRDPGTNPRSIGNTNNPFYVHIPGVNSSNGFDGLYDGYLSLGSLVAEVDHPFKWQFKGGVGRNYDVLYYVGWVLFGATIFFVAFGVRR